MKELQKCFKGLADQNRLRIINLLLHGELCGCDVQYVLNNSQPNVSRHLTYLKNAGLVQDRRDGFRIFYRLAEPQKAVRRQLFEFLRAAFKEDGALRHDIERLKQAIKGGACTVDEWRPYAALTKLKTTAVHV
ncbi:MAG TPA: metalloregulator ArsR/SmtB family transcription factor [Terriglobales bacterium]|jgi:ArsR family transcriptional regulator|nr:metalloregulator ArsR/SmtB family transcription factor [Terriglobales bacterium]